MPRYCFAAGRCYREGGITGSHGRRGGGGGLQDCGPTLIAALKACGRARDFDTGKKLHLEHHSHGDIFVETSLVAMYARCGSMADARRVFDAMRRHNAVSWTALIAGYAENRDPDSAIAAFHAMLASGCEADATAFVAAVAALSSKIEGESLRAARQLLPLQGGTQMPSLGICASDGVPENHVSRKIDLGLLDAGMAIHCRARRHESDIFVASALLDMYSKLSSVEDARIVFDRMPRHDVVSWTTLILAYVENGDDDLALELFDSMPPGCDPDARTFVAAIMASGNLASLEDAVDVDGGKMVKPKSLERCRAIHSLAAEKGCAEDLFVASKLVDAYSKSGAAEEAWMVFQAMPRHDLVALNSMVLGLAENGEGDRALGCFHCLEQCLEPDARSFTAAIAGIASTAAKEPGREVEGRVVKLESLGKAMEIHARAEKKGWCRSDVFLLNSLIGMYAKCGSMVDSQRVFDRMPARTAVSWSSLILGYVENGDDDLALELFDRMKRSPQSPSPPCARAYVAALMACSSLAALEAGRALHREASMLGFTADTYLAVTLVDFYGKCGSMEEAEKVFRSMDERRKNKVAWSALLAGYSRQGDAGRVFATFEEMRGSGVEPCAVAFVSLLAACSHAGLVDRGREIFSAMVERYRIAPLAEHYNCMVDMLGRANLLDEALAVATGSSFVANAATWKIVLGACHKWKNLAIARVAFEALVAMDPRLDVAYVVMASVLGSAGLWEEQARVLERRGKAGTWKKAGQSWWVCPRSGIVHKFRAGDANHHPQGDAIAAKIKELLGVMKERHGYVADMGCVTHNIAEVEKEGTLCGHSERLAIACAIVNTPARESVRVVKNLRVCEDCHRATAIISRIEERVIVCRDTSRFHVFESGECSCKNFW
ncbi:pentatricopeptide repeat-containing protein At4g30700 [Selaginella moellendorffii]|uniref:pentatricopeptide repeat-containing protein At4g30700 n=1 Tax=Selaginella moellendorffii TaxID=88036 RepID=UPI000D1C51E2|nr:pentatricopeptide repeat-containing protein At4g30700 [Selaginella moellendorffii]|eukprot:XP_024534497.1 pentatricopeptide repeat-containing protein At4g30700 [Selaginella moellendorffii]